jgi:hypothetical protein
LDGAGWTFSLPRSFSARNRSELPFTNFVVSQMRAHEALPKLSVVGGEEVEEFMHDDVVGQLGVERE